MADRIRISTNKIEAWAHDLARVEGDLTAARGILENVSLTEENGGKVAMSVHETLSNGARLDGSDAMVLLHSLDAVMKNIAENTAAVSTGLSRAASVFEDAQGRVDSDVDGLSDGRQPERQASGVVPFSQPSFGGNDALSKFFKRTKELLSRARELKQVVEFYKTHPDPGADAEKARDAELIGDIRDALTNGSCNREAWENASVEEKKRLLNALISDLNPIYGTNVVEEIDYFDGKPVPVPEFDEKIDILQHEIMALENEIEQIKKEYYSRVEGVELPKNDPNELAQIKERIEKKKQQISEQTIELKRLERERQQSAILTNGEYDDDKRQVRINTNALKELSYEEMMEVVVHEMRHAYQHEAIRRPGDFTVSKDTVIKWLGNFANYKDGKDDSYNYDGYRHQPVEEDAFSFADRLF